MTVRVLGVIAALVLAGCAAAPSATPDVADATASPSPAPTSEGTPVDPLTGELQALAQRLLPPGATVTGHRETPVVVELYGRSDRSLRDIEDFWRATLIALDRSFGITPDPFGRVTATLYDPHGALTARPDPEGAGVEIVISLAREVAAPATPAPTPKVLIMVDVTKATPCCETLEDGPGQVTRGDPATEFEWRREHPALVDEADMFVALWDAIFETHAARTGLNDFWCVAYAVPDATERETVLRYLAFRGTGSSLAPEQVVRSGDEPEVADAIRIFVTDLEVTRREGPRYVSGDLSFGSYGYDLRADVGVVSTEGGGPEGVVLQAEFPDEVTIEGYGLYFGGASLRQLAEAMLPYIDSVLGDPCAL